MQERKQYKISLPMTEKQKNNVEELLRLFANFSGKPFRLEEIEEAEDVQEEKEWPQDGDNYYYIHSNGEIANSNFYLNDSFCKNILSVGNYFRTREEAEFEVERLKVLEEMKKFAESEDREWDGINEHWCIIYQCSTFVPSIKFLFKIECKYDGIYFETEEKARECVKAVGEDRIKKYYLGVEE